MSFALQMRRFFVVTQTIFQPLARFTRSFADRTGYCVYPARDLRVARITSCAMMEYDRQRTTAVLTEIESSG